MKRNIESGTIARTVVLVVALLNQVLMMAGKNLLPFADNAVYEGVTTSLAVMASVIAWWKNNSFTQQAIQSDKKLKELKSKN